MMDIKKFTTGRGAVRWRKCFFDRVTILFHQCNNTNITYQQFSYLRWYFTHCYYCDTTMCFPIPLKIALRPQKCIFPHCFWPRWLKQTSFCRQLDYLDCHIRSFCVFDLLPLIKKTHEKTRDLKKIIFFNILFKNSKTGNVTPCS